MTERRTERQHETLRQVNPLFVRRVIPEHLVPEQRAVEAQIREAFRAVRNEGVSWSEAKVIDRRGTDAERAAASALDTENGWEQLVDDPNWFYDMDIVRFCFLDAAGYRYYLAPAMIRSVRGQSRCDLPLTISNEFFREKVRLIDPAQARAIARFLRFMIAACAKDRHSIFRERWEDALESYWRPWDVDSELT